MNPMCLLFRRLFVFPIILVSMSAMSYAGEPRLVASDPNDATFEIFSEITVTAYPDAKYDQDRRPQYHFTSKRNWLNDPNGLVHDGKKYHLFFQHNPMGTQWGNMTWGHATSKDMLRWEQQEHALIPYQVDNRQGVIFSGSAILDHMDSLGRATKTNNTLAAFFTYAAEPAYYQAMAFSTDLGETWTLHNNGRAIIPNQGMNPEERDPKIFWHGPTEQWGMVLWVDQDPKTKIGTMRFFMSDDMVRWRMACDVKRPWAYECPDVFFATVDGKGKPKTVLYDASGDYEIGVFDGKSFKAETERLSFGEGGNIYAAQVFNNQPQFRTIQMAWMNDAPAAEAANVPFCGQMTIPVQLRLVSTKAGPRLSAKPIAEIASLVQREQRFDSIALGDSPTQLAIEPAVEVDLDISIEMATATSVTMQFGGIEFRYLLDGGVLSFAGPEGPIVLMENLRPIDGTLDLRLLIDRMSVEVFAEDGQRWTAHYAMPNLQPAPPTLWCAGGEAIVSGVVRQMMSALP